MKLKPLAISKAEAAKNLLLRNKLEPLECDISKALTIFMAPHTCRAQIQASCLQLGMLSIYANLAWHTWCTKNKTEYQHLIQDSGIVHEQREGELRLQRQ